MSGPNVSSTDEMVAEYVRSSMRVDPPATMNQELVRAVAQVPQQRRGWFNALALPAPALAAVAATALIIVVSAFLVGPRLIGPPAEPTASPMPTLTAEADRVLTQPGDVIRIPALDSQGQFGIITIERGEERARYEEYLPLAGLDGQGLFFVEVHIEYELNRAADDDYGNIDFGWAIDADRDGLDADDLLNQHSGYAWDGTELQTGPQPPLPWLRRGTREDIGGWIALELPAVGAEYDIYLVQLAEYAEGPEFSGFEATASALLRSPGEPVGTTSYNIDDLPLPTGPAASMPEFQRLPTPAPTPAETYEPEPNVEVDALMAETQTCENADLQVTITFPSSWFTNPAYEDMPACILFAPEPIDSELIYNGLVAELPPLSMQRSPSWMGGADQPTVPQATFTRVPMAGRLAWYLTFSDHPARYFLVQLTDDPYGPFMRAHARPEWFALLERMVIALEFEE